MLKFVMTQRLQSALDVGHVHVIDLALDSDRRTRAEVGGMQALEQPGRGPPVAGDDLAFRVLARSRGIADQTDEPLGLLGLRDLDASPKFPVGGVWVTFATPAPFPDRVGRHPDRLGRDLRMTAVDDRFADRVNHLGCERTRSRWRTRAFPFWYLGIYDPLCARPPLAWHERILPVLPARRKPR